VQHRPDPLFEVIAAGHLCLDIIPQLPTGGSAEAGAWQIEPGTLCPIGPATLSLGGSVANTGLALKRLGAEVRLVARVGDDHLGSLVRRLLGEHGESLAAGPTIAVGDTTSYSIVISPPGVDRSFLHCPGANDRFTAEELDRAPLDACRLLHFGYPPLMAGVLADGGEGIAGSFAAVESAGGIVSLDMAAPDARLAWSPPRWRSWLRTVLPHVDLFLPSLDELLMLLEPDTYAELAAEAPDNVARAASEPLLARLSDELLALGARTTIIKLGDEGLYLRSGSGPATLPARRHWAEYDWESWRDRELWAPCLEAPVVGTTGAGDCTIAGLLMAMLRGLSCDSALRAAVAVGAWSVKSLDALGAIRSWGELLADLDRPWPSLKPQMPTSGWEHDPATRLFVGPSDARGADTSAALLRPSGKPLSTL
jgi:sugar/nucleoside kinase (ribokinase family)